LTANEVYKIVLQFINNDFAHHVEKQEKDMSVFRKSQTRLYLTLLGGLISIVVGLLVLILR